MKKTILYSLAALAVFGLASCDGDYDDWASPQSYGQDAAAAKYGLTFSAGSEINSVLPNAGDTIHLVTVSTTDPDVAGYTIKTLSINGQDINGFMDGNDICVDAATLEKTVIGLYDSRQATARDIEVKANVSMNLTSGDAVVTSTEADIKGSVTPQPTPAIDTKGYYLLGDFTQNGTGWDLTQPVWMTNNGDGTYTAVVTTTSDGDNWYKFYCGSYYNSSNWDTVNKGQMGCAVNGDKSRHNTLVYTGDPLLGDAQTPVIHGAGTFIVKLDMNNLTYTVSDPVLYVAGDANGWTQTEPLASNDGNAFTGFAYLNGNGFKFCSQKDWNGTNYGQNFSTAADAANWALPSGYTEGYYKIDLNVSAGSMTLTKINSIGVIGDATADGWNSDQNMTYNKTTHAWEISNITLKQGSIKFRANDDWTYNWGGTLDRLNQGGDNINVDAGTYDIQLFAWADGYGYVVMTKK